MVPTVSIIVPSRNEPYLQKTIDDLIQKAEGFIEIIVILDGYWTTLVEDPRVHILHRGEVRGMRAAINDGVALAKGKYILKCDAHCMFDQGYDVKLIADMQEKVIMVPRRYRLDPVKWEIIQDGRPPIDRMYLSKDLHGKDWQTGNHADQLIEETPSSQGSCWIMEKNYYKELELLDEEAYGTFWNEFQEIGLKCWLSDGRVLVNKKTWYAHWHKQSRGYDLNEKSKLKEFNWHKANRPISWLFERFKV